MMLLKKIFFHSNDGIYPVERNIFICTKLTVKGFKTSFATFSLMLAPWLTSVNLA